MLSATTSGLTGHKFKFFVKESVAGLFVHTPPNYLDVFKAWFVVIAIKDEGGVLLLFILKI